MDLDVCSVTQGDKRVWSFFSQSLGLMADLDLGKLSSFIIQVYLSGTYIFYRNGKPEMDGRHKIRRGVP